MVVRLTLLSALVANHRSICSILLRAVALIGGVRQQIIFNCVSDRFSSNLIFKKMNSRISRTSKWFSLVLKKEIKKINLLCTMLNSKNIDVDATHFAIPVNIIID